MILYYNCQMLCLIVKFRIAWLIPSVKKILCYFWRFGYFRHEINSIPLAIFINQATKRNAHISYRRLIDSIFKLITLAVRFEIGERILCIYYPSLILFP